jgi:ABC-type lipopolysaccharide export system ATPase subunit
MTPLNTTSADFEQAALARFRSLVGFLPQDSRIFRELSGRSTVLCLDFVNCPYLFNVDEEQARSLSKAVVELGLADSMIFRLGSKIVGWKKVMP